MDFFRDPIVSTIISIIGLVVGTFSLVVAIVGLAQSYFVLRPNKRFRWMIRDNFSLLSIHEGDEEEFQIVFRGKPVTQVRSILLKLWNNGNTQIVADDFETPLSINVEGASKIIDAEIVETDPPNLSTSLSREDQQVALEPVLFNAGDSVKIKLFIDQFVGNINVMGRIVGVRKIETEDMLVNMDLRNRAMNFVGLRSAVFILVFLTANLGVISIVNELGFKIQPGSYIDGMIAAGIIGLVWFWLQDWRSTVTKVYENGFAPGGYKSARWEIIRGIFLILVIAALMIWLVADLFRR